MLTLLMRYSCTHELHRLPPGSWSHLSDFFVDIPRHGLQRHCRMVSPTAAKDLRLRDKYNISRPKNSRSKPRTGAFGSRVAANDRGQGPVFRWHKCVRLLEDPLEVPNMVDENSNGETANDILDEMATHVSYGKLPFDHPIYILYSSVSVMVQAQIESTKAYHIQVWNNWST